MNEQLFEQNLYPVASEIGFLQCPMETVVSAYLAWQTPLQAKSGVRLKQKTLAGPLAHLLKSLYPLTNVERRRFLFVPTTSDWTAYFDNGHQGPDPGPPISYLSEEIGCRGLRVACTPHIPPNIHGTVLFEVYAPQPTDYLNIERTIYAGHNGARWEFDASGTPLPFEDLSAYKARKIADRFTQPMLRTYMQALGLADDSRTVLPQNISRAVLLEKEGPCSPQMDEFAFGSTPC